MQLTRENIKYCLLTWNQLETEHVMATASPGFMHSGLFKWAHAFNGKTRFPRTYGEFEEFNVVHINVTHNNLFTIAKILPLINRSRTLLLMNVDYAVELWNHNLQHPHLLLSMLDEADRVFTVEPEAADMLSMHLKRPVAIMPHPTDTNFLKTFRVDERDASIGISIHTYDQNAITPWYPVRNAIPLSWLTVALGASDCDPCRDVWEEFIPRTPPTELMKIIAQLYAMIETYTIHSYGRVTIECAALGVPVIGSRVVASQSRLFPNLTTEYNSARQTAALLEQLVSEPAFWTENVQRAEKELEYYSLDACADRMLNFLNEGT